MEFSKDLREARAQTGLSQQTIFALTKIPKRTIEDWEAGRRTPPEYIQLLVLEKLQAMARHEEVQGLVEQLRKYSEEASNSQDNHLAEDLMEAADLLERSFA